MSSLSRLSPNTLKQLKEEKYTPAMEGWIISIKTIIEEMVLILTYSLFLVIILTNVQNNARDTISMRGRIAKNTSLVAKILED